MACLLSYMYACLPFLPTAARSVLAARGESNKQAAATSPPPPKQPIHTYLPYIHANYIPPTAFPPGLGSTQRKILHGNWVAGGREGGPPFLINHGERRGQFRHLRLPSSFGVGARGMMWVRASRPQHKVSHSHCFSSPILFSLSHNLSLPPIQNLSRSTE